MESSDGQTLHLTPFFCAWVSELRFAYIENARSRIIDKISARVERAETLRKKFDVLRDAVYELVESITDEGTLARLLETP